MQECAAISENHSTRTDAARPEKALRGLKGPLWLSLIGLWAEALTRAFWPVWTVLLLGFAMLTMGVHENAPLELAWAVAVAAAVGLIWFTIRGIMRFRRPVMGDAIARVDGVTRGRPFAALMDQQAIGAGDAASRAVWQAHRDRMHARAQEARPVAPDLRLSRRDPYGLRYVALLLALIAVPFAARLSARDITALTPVAAGPVAPANPASWEGWVAPPAYTGLPTLYLNEVKPGTLKAPVGSRITLRLYGEPGALIVEQDVADVAPPKVPEPAATAKADAKTGAKEGTEDSAKAEAPAYPKGAEPLQDMTLSRSGTLAINGPGGREWQIAILPDTPPVIAPSGPATTSAAGAFNMPFTAKDDYEVLGAKARIALDLSRIKRRHGLTPDPEPREVIVVDLPLPLTKGRNDFTETLIEEFSKHAWANLPVTITLTAVDAAGNEGKSAPEPITLAARHFFDPVAAAVIELRRDLLWNRENAPRVAQLIRALTHKPAGLFKRQTDYMRLRFILRRLEIYTMRDPLTDARRDELAEAMWDLALKLEEGTLADALARMRQARERLEQAMRNGASEAEIARLMDDLRDATNKYLDQLARQNPPDNRDQPDQGNRNAMTMNQQDLQRMMDRIQELMKQGRMAEAQKALEEYQRMIENMRITQGRGGQGQNSPGRRAMEGLADTLRKQQGLSDQAFRNLQEQFNPNARRGESQGNQGRNGGQGQGQRHEGQPGQRPGQGGQPQMGQNGQQQGQQQGQQPGQGRGQQGQQPGQSGQQGQQGGGQGMDGRALSQRQRDLRRLLDQQRRGLPGAGTKGGDAARKSLDRAGRAMDGAEKSLKRNDLAGAIDKQAQAMEALRDSMRQLGEALADAQRQNNPQQGQGRASAQGGQRRLDPLGRSLGGPSAVREDMLQGEDVYRRARDLLEEIRRRSGEAGRPKLELDYLKRLLNRF